MKTRIKEKHNAHLDAINKIAYFNKKIMTLVIALPVTLVFSYIVSGHFSYNFITTFVVIYSINVFPYFIFNSPRNNISKLFYSTIYNRYSEISSKKRIALRNHHNYYINQPVQDVIQGKVWENLYSFEYSMKSGGLFFLTVLIVVGMFNFLESINIPGLMLIILSCMPMFFGIYIFVKMRKSYKSKISFDTNRYLFCNLNARKYMFHKKNNELGGYDYIFQKD